MTRRSAFVPWLLPLVLACRGSGPAPAASAPPPATPVTSTPSPASVDDRPVVLFVGTSLTAGLGLDPGEAYPALLQEKIDAAGLRYRVVNAGVSGETSAGARRRMAWLLRQPVAVFVVETGANDGLRGQDPEATRANIREILARALRRRPPKLVLAGMKVVTNYGRDYGRRFEAVYPEVASETGAALVPFLLEGVAGVEDLNPRASRPGRSSRWSPTGSRSSSPPRRRCTRRWSRWADSACS